MKLPSALDRWRPFARGVNSASVSLRLLVLPLLLGGCTNLFFQPMRQHVHSPAALGVTHEEVYFTTEDGVRLHGWFLPAPAPARGTVVFLHGNAENISTHIASVYWLPAQGFNVFLPDYRGYGRSQGAPSLPGVLADVDSGVRYLLGRADVDSARLVVLGQSLGGALAGYYVAHSRYRAHIRAVVIDSAFASYRAITREKLAQFWLTWPLSWPLGFTVDDDYSPVRRIGQISPIPVLVIHGDSDGIVPAAHGRRLYEAAQPPKDFWLVPGARHIESLRLPAYRQRLVEYLNERLALPAAEPHR